MNQTRWLLLFNSFLFNFALFECFHNVYTLSAQPGRAKQNSCSIMWTCDITHSQWMSYKACSAYSQLCVIAGLLSDSFNHTVQKSKLVCVSMLDWRMAACLIIWLPTMSWWRRRWPSSSEKHWRPWSTFIPVEWHTKTWRWLQVFVTYEKKNIDNCCLLTCV